MPPQMIAGCRNHGPGFTCQGLRVGPSGIESARHSLAMRCALPLLVLLSLAWTLAPSLAREAPGKPVPALDLFKQGEIPRVRLELSDDAMGKLRVSPRKYVVGTVVEGA